MLLDGIGPDGEITQSAKDQVDSLLHHTFRPEFLNRLDEIVFYKPLTRENIVDDDQRANIHNTFTALTKIGVVPIINENDTVATAELKHIENFGDNDTLSAVVARMCDADLLVIFSDIDGLYDSNPRTNPQAKLINHVGRIDAKIRRMAGGAGSAHGTGGMATKITAAELCMDAGIPMMVANGDKQGLLYDIVDGKEVGTLFQRER